MTSAMSSLSPSEIFALKMPRPFSIKLLLFLALLCVSPLGAKAATPKRAQAPAGTWEAWLQDLHQRAPKVAPRPDGKNLSLRLPIWVDCHLSWLFENRSHLPKDMSFPEEIVLQSSSEECAFQMERWASPEALKALRPKN